MNPSPLDYTQRLRSLMTQVNLSSFRALSRVAGVSVWQVEQLRQGKAARMQAKFLYKLSRALQVSLEALLSQFSEMTLSQTPAPAASQEALQREYDRLQAQLNQQQELLQQEFQQATLQKLESLILQYPTIAYAAQQKPQLAVTVLLPHLRSSLEPLLKDWGIEPIGSVGDEISYDPQWHQLMEGTAQPGDRVRVRYQGYCQGEKLLYRAKVSRASPTSA